MAYLLAGLTFLIVALIALAAAFLTGSGDQERVIANRLEAIEKSTKRGNVSLELQVVRDEMLSGVPALHRLLLRWEASSRLREYVAQAGLKTKPGALLLWSAVLGLGGYIAAVYFLQYALLGVVGALAGAACPILFVVAKRRHRLHKFEKTFPEAIDLLGRAVRAGHSFSTGLEMIATELPEPVAGEFRATFEEQNFGLPLRDALLNLADRIPLIDVRFFVTALLIQKETGGNLAEILDGLARVIRDRFRILGEVRIRTAQGRLTAAILIALPPLMIVALRALNPNYMYPLFHDPWGPYMLAFGAILQVIGSVMLWKIVNIEV